MSIAILMLTPTSNYLFYYKVDDDADARSVQSISLPVQNISSSVTNISPSIHRYFISVYRYPPPPFTLCLSPFAVILTPFMVFPSLFTLFSSLFTAFPPLSTLVFSPLIEILPLVHLFVILVVTFHLNSLLRTYWSSLPHDVFSLFFATYYFFSSPLLPLQNLSNSESPFLSSIDLYPHNIPFQVIFPTTYLPYQN